MLAKFDALGQGQFAGPVDRVGLAAHIGFPGIGAGLTAAAGIFFAAKSAADFRAAGADVDIGDAAVGAFMGEKAFGRADAVGEHGAGKPLGDAIVQSNSFIEITVGQQVKDGREGFFFDDFSLGRHLDDRRFDKVRA